MDESTSHFTAGRIEACERGLARLARLTCCPMIHEHRLYQLPVSHNACCRRNERVYLQAEHGRSFFNPPRHFHMYQSEEFLVVSGTARFFLDDETHIRSKGEIMNIPVGAFHCYENASERGEDLVVSFRLDPQKWVVEERFFRNFFGYLEDVRKIEQQPSVFQLFSFLYEVDAPLAVPVLGMKSHWVSRQVSWLVMVVAGVVVGEWLLGYKGPYEEYYTDDVDKDK